MSLETKHSEYTQKNVEFSRRHGASLVKERKNLLSKLRAFTAWFTDTLASKTVPAPLHIVLESVTKIGNYIKSGTLTSCLFKEPCKDIDSHHEGLLYYTSVSWSSKDNVNRVFELEDEIQLLLKVQVTWVTKMMKPARILFCFGKKLLPSFWCAMYQSHPNVTMLAFRVLIPFAST